MIHQWFSTLFSSRHTKHQKKMGGTLYLENFEKDLEKEHFYKLHYKPPQEKIKVSNIEIEYN